MLTYTLPYPPSVNTYWRVFRNRAILSTAGRNYKKAVADELVGCKKMGGQFHMIVYAEPGTNRRRDIDNISKSLIDAMKGLAFKDDDDRYLRGLCLFWGPLCRPDGRVTVMLCKQGEVVPAIDRFLDPLRYAMLAREQAQECGMPT